MKNGILLIFIFFASLSFLQAQNKEPFKQHFTLNVIAPTYFYSPRWSLGYYEDMNERFRIGGELGVGFRAAAINPDPFDSGLIQNDYFSIEIAPELMWFVEKTDEVNSFFSIEAFYIYHSDFLNNSLYTSDRDGLRYSYDRASYTRNKYGLNVNYGWMVSVTRHLGIIPKIGIGIKSRDVRFAEFTNRNAVLLPLDEDSFVPAANDYITIEGNRTALNINIEFHVYYAF